jgi:hypothetical protein
MSHPLQQRIRGLRSRVLRLVAIHGLSTMVTAVLAIVIALGWIDYWGRFRDRGILTLFAFVVLTVLAWTGYLAVRRLLGARLGDANVALHVEACFPEVKDRLTSAVEFLRQAEGDALAGSAAMRRAAIAQATAASEELDFRAAIDNRPALRAALAALAVGLVAVCLVVKDASAARTALSRLAFPLGTTEWPQRTHLGPRKATDTIVRGQPLEIEAFDVEGTPLPIDCRIHYRLTDAQGRMKEETEPMQMLGKTLVARRDNVTSALDYCFTGGDDQKRIWTEVQVIDPPEPPAVRTLKLTVTPPAYTNWPAEDREATSNRPILAGSRVLFAGQTTKPLKPMSTMRFDDGRSIPLQIDADGTTFHVGQPAALAPSKGPGELVLERSAGYSLHLVGIDGVEGDSPESWQLRVVTDAPPSVSIEQPAADLFVTGKAVVNYRIRARDDMALRQVALSFASSDGKLKGKTVLLHDGPMKPPQSSASSFDTGAPGEQSTIDRAVELSELQPVPGTQVTCHALATDYHSQTGRSDPRVLIVITADQLLERMAVRQSLILAELIRVLQLQRDTCSQVRLLEIRLHETGSLEQPDIDRLQAAEFSQREILRSLTSRSDGLPKQILGLLADLETNRIDNPDFQRRLQGVLAAFDRIEREHLPRIGSELTAVIKGALVRLQASPRPAGRDSEGQGHLADAIEHQEQIITSLEALLASLRQWDDYRRFHREIAQLLRDQVEIARSTTALGAQTVGRDAKELSSQELAELKVLVERQFELARLETRLEAEMERTAAVLTQNEPLAAGTLNDAVAEARRLAIAVDMTTAGGKIRDNEMGLVPADQQRLLKNIQEVLDILANNRPQELTRVALKLDEARKGLAGLSREQEGLRQKLDETIRSSGAKAPATESQKAELRRLARRQEQLRKQAEALGRRLERLLAEDPAAAMAKAVERMEQSRHSGEAGDGPGASQGATGAGQALKDAIEKLGKRRFEIAVQLAMEQQARLQETLKHLQRQEERIASETREFADLERGGLSRAQESSLMELAHQQDLLRAETGRVLRALATADVFRLALSSAVDEMGCAFELLQRRQTGPATQRFEQNAIDRIKQMLVALQAEEPGETPIGKSSDASPDDPTKPPGNQAAPEPRNVLPLAQLKLLKTLQEDLNRRTAELNHAAAAGKTPAELREAYTRLSEEQARLADLTYQLLRPQPQDGEGLEEENKPGESKEKEP